MKFTRKDLHKKKRLTPSWRKPKGLQNKQRLGHKCHSPKVKPGYGTPNEEKNKFKGKDIVHISKIEDLKIYDSKKETLNISKVSKKNKVAIIKEAKKQGFEFANFNADKYLEKVEEELKQRQAAKKSAKKKVEDKKEKDKSLDKKEESDEKSQEELKKEKDKVLTKSK